jgi:hypothetical protein
VRQESSPTDSKKAEDISDDDSDVNPITTPQVQPRKRRALTALEVDKMPFNPQYDWEKDIYSGPKH